MLSRLHALPPTRSPAYTVSRLYALRLPAYQSSYPRTCTLPHLPAFYLPLYLPPYLPTCLPNRQPTRLPTCLPTSPPTDLATYLQTQYIFLCTHLKNNTNILDFIMALRRICDCNYDISNNDISI